ncbi:MAG: flagellar basal body rod C-terminal domain-containing protein, partial [Sphingomonas sp.]
AIRDNAVAARDAVSGVNLDSEAVDLLRFQQAYQASSRVIQVARDTLQSILDIH